MTSDLKIKENEKENLDECLVPPDVPKYEVTSVDFKKTATLNRENDLVYQANLEAIKEIKNLQLTCKQNGSLF